MRKIILCLFCIFFCFGCTAKYNLKINDDLSFEETITGLEDENFYDYFVSSKSDVINSVLSSYKGYLNSQSYNITSKSDDSLYGASAFKKYFSYKDFLNNSKVYVPYYENFNVSEDNGIITISLNNKIIDDNFSNRYIVDDGEIVISLPFKVIDNNADKVDKKNGKYIWNFDLKEDKDIYIKFDSKNNIKKDNYFAIIVGIIFILSLFGFIVYKIYKKKKLVKDEI